MLNESSIAKTEKRIYDLLPHEPETMAVTLFIIAMAIYYLWRMFAITPCYDELYAYYMFISRGPFYVITNWTAPNNHVGYSLFAGIVNFCGNPYIGLRGISYICAVCNLILVYRICRKYYTHGMPLGALILYASMQVVNEYSIQGRGYTLATTCFLLAVYAVGEMCKSGEIKILHYVGFSFAIVVGVYTVPDSVYWAVPVCLSAYLYLFINGFKSRSVFSSDAENFYLKKLNKLISYTAFSIFAAFILYGGLWLSIGASELIKDDASRFFESTGDVVLIRSPMEALGRGLSFMLSKRSAVDVGKDLFKVEFWSWVKELFNYMLPGMWMIIAFFIVAGMIIMIVECARHFGYSRTVFNIMAVTNIFFVAIVLIGTHKLPNLRGFGYGSFFATVCICATLEKVINATIRIYNNWGTNNSDASNVANHRENERIRESEKWYKGLGIYIPLAAIIVLFIARLFGSTFNAQIGERENNIFNTMYIAGIDHRKKPCVLDCDQKYLLKFGFDIECEKVNVADSDCVILDRKLMEPGKLGEDAWKYYTTYETIDWDYLDTMHIQYENEDLILYTK